MKRTSKTGIIFGVWAVLALLLGSVLMSYHQPFLAPADEVLSLAGPGDGTHWRAVHLLSGSCGCSQRVMKHLLERGPLTDVAEEVIILDGGEPYLPGSLDLMHALPARGFTVAHRSTHDIPAKAQLRGVPLLVFANPQSETAYVGGYGMTQDGDTGIYHQLRAGGRPKPLAVLGCAVGAGLRRAADPFRFKY